MAAIGGFRSDLSITRKTDRHVGNVSAGVLVVYHLHRETVWSMVCENGKQSSHWKIPFLVGVYHLNNRPNLAEEPRTSLTSSKWRLRSSY